MTEERNEQEEQPRRWEPGQFEWDAEDEELDPELVALAESRAQGSVLRPVLMIAVIIFGAYIIKDWQEELAYFFQPSEPMVVGNVTEFPVRAAEEPGWEPELPHNRFVALSGVPSRRSQSEKYRYFKLVGGEVYVEQLRDDYTDNALERELQKDKPGEIDRTFFEGAGRLLSFAKMPERYHGLRDYYRTRYNVRFCEQYDERELARVAEARRDTIRQNWRIEYEKATPEEREERGLRPQPTDEELAEVFDSEPLCVEAYLLQADVTPRKHWWYVAVSALVAIFMVINSFLLLRWLWRAARN